jgi:excisionase family DNA binding protein
LPTHIGPVQLRCRAPTQVSLLEPVVAQPPDPPSLTRTDVLSTSEVADLLGIPRSTVHHLARRGDLPARRVGRRWLFLRDRLAAAITPLDDPAAWQPERRV